MPGCAGCHLDPRPPFSLLGGGFPLNSVAMIMSAAVALLRSVSCARGSASIDLRSALSGTPWVRCCLRNSLAPDQRRLKFTDLFTERTCWATAVVDGAGVDPNRSCLRALLGEPLPSVRKLCGTRIGCRTPARRDRCSSGHDGRCRFCTVELGPAVRSRRTPPQGEPVALTDCGRDDHAHRAGRARILRYDARD